MDIPALIRMPMSMPLPMPILTPAAIIITWISITSPDMTTTRLFIILPTTRIQTALPFVNC